LSFRSVDGDEHDVNLSGGDEHDVNFSGGDEHILSYVDNDRDECKQETHKVFHTLEI
jgi:hypothetical protein